MDRREWVLLVASSWSQWCYYAVGLEDRSLIIPWTCHAVLDVPLSVLSEGSAESVWHYPP